MRNMGFRMGFRTVAIAAGLALAGLSGSAGAVAPAAPHAATSAAPTGAAAVAAPTNAKPVSATATSASPLLAMDGAPAMTVQPGIGQPTAKLFGLQPQVTSNGRFAHWMHDIILVPTITIISLFVLALLLWVVVRFRRAANPNPSRNSHNTVLEVAWTLIPVLILVLIAVPSIGLLQAQYKPAPAGAITLKATGNQWYWTYSYPDNGGFEITANMLKEKADVAPGERFRTDADGPKLLAADTRVVLPVGVPIRLITTGADVIHSWAVPAFWIKLDAVPGRLNETSFTIEKPGLYFGQCSELCGARHGFMPIAVEAVSPAQFAAWVKAKGGTMPAAGKPSAALIPQAGAAESAAKATEGNAAAAEAGPVVAATTAAPVITQGATGNPAGAGQAGH